MTGVYTEDTLKALNKTQLIDLFLKMQDQTNSTIDSLMAEMKDLNNGFNPFQASVPFLYSLKTSENQRFSDVFRGYRKGTLA